MLIQRLEAARSSVGRGWRHGVEWEAWSSLFLQVESLLMRHGLEGVRAREREAKYGDASGKVFNKTVTDICTSGLGVRPMK